MTAVYFDWSIRNGVTAIENWDDRAVRYQTLRQVMDLLQPGDRLIGEATFSSFDVKERARLIGEAKRRGIVFLTTPTRLTSRARLRLGLAKTDENDAKAIREVAQDPSRLKPPALPDPEWVAVREEANGMLMDLRRSGTLTPKPRSEGFNFTSAKDLQAEEWIKYLPSYRSLTPVQQKALGDGKEYSRVIIAAVGVATVHAETTREFDRLSGLYAHAYPSQIRADLHHYAWAGGNTRAKLAADWDVVEGKRVIPSPTRRLDGLTFSDYRRELRWLYHQMKTFV